MAAEAVKRMREASGCVDDASPLVRFLYLLMRDEVALGVVEDLAIKATGQMAQFTNGWLAKYAQDVATRLTAVETGSPAGEPER